MLGDHAEVNLEPDAVELPCVGSRQMSMRRRRQPTAGRAALALATGTLFILVAASEASPAPRVPGSDCNGEAVDQPTNRSIDDGRGE